MRQFVSMAPVQEGWPGVSCVPSVDGRVPARGVTWCWRDGSEVRWKFSQCGGAAGPHCAADSCLLARSAPLTRAPAATCLVLPVPRLLLLLLLSPHSKYSYSANEYRRCQDAIITLLAGTRRTFHLMRNLEPDGWTRVSSIVHVCTLIGWTLEHIE